MPKVKHIFPLLFFMVATFYAQDFSTVIEGRVYSKDGDVAAVHVSNITSRRGTITNIDGFFEIAARLNDTLVFSAVQYKRVELIVNLEILESDLLQVPLQESLTVLDEVVVRPYNLSGDLNRDMGNMKIKPVVTASTLGLPNAYVKVKTQSERRLFEADNGKFITLKFDSLLDPTIKINFWKMLNRFTGRTKMLKRYVAMDKEIELLKKVRAYYPDSVYVRQLKVPEIHLDKFWYFCEADPMYNEVVETDDRLQIWEWLKNMSALYREEKDINSSNNVKNR